jgi:hypothetical protein
MQQTLQTDPLAPFYLGRARSHRPLPRGFTGHVTNPIRSIAVCRTSIADDLRETKFQL